MDGFDLGLSLYSQQLHLLLQLYHILLQLGTVPDTLGFGAHFSRLKHSGNFGFKFQNTAFDHVEIGSVFEAFRTFVDFPEGVGFDLLGLEFEVKFDVLEVGR